MQNDLPDLLILRGQSLKLFNTLATESCKADKFEYTNVIRYNKVKEMLTIELQNLDYKAYSSHPYFNNDSTVGVLVVNGYMQETIKQFPFHRIQITNLEDLTPLLRVSVCNNGNTFEVIMTKEQLDVFCLSVLCAGTNNSVQVFVSGFNENSSIK